MLATQTWSPRTVVKFRFLSLLNTLTNRKRAIYLGEKIEGNHHQIQTKEFVSSDIFRFSQRCC